MVTTWWIHQDHLNAAKKLRHQQSFTSLFAWARKSCANDHKAQKILACNDGEKKRPPPHIHIKWPLWMYWVQYTLIFLFKRCNLTKGRNIFKHEKHIQHLFRVSRNIGPWHNQHFGPSLTSEGKLSQFVRCFISNYLCHTRQTLTSTMMMIRRIFCMMMKWRWWWKYDWGSFKWVNKGNCGKTFLHQSQTGTNEHWEEKYWAWGWLLGNPQNIT